MSRTISFVDQCIAGEALVDDIEAFIEAWHEGSDRRDLHEYLGMTWDEYSLWLTEPDMLSHIVTAHKDSLPLATVIDRTQNFELAAAARSGNSRQAKKLLLWLKQREEVR